MEQRNSDRFILNIVHRPELTPEYAEKTGGADRVVGESLDIFSLQQEIAHKNGLRCTIQMTYASLFNAQAVALAKEHHATYGDEIGLTLLGLPCEEFEKKYHTKDFCIWMFSMEDKRRIVDDVFELFYERFGAYPTSTGSYYMDAALISYIKRRYPSVKCAVATCFEEGPKAYHTCNNSWYTFFDGGPWAPWIPSRQNTHAPAANAEEDSGIVAIPHLSRDLIACFDGNGSNFGTHPQNVLRGMIYRDGQYPYLFNLIDQYRHLGKYNQGYAYNMVFVGPGWMNKRGRWEAPYSLLKQSYEDCMAYYGKLKREGALTDMTMTEFADWFRQNRRYAQPECALWSDILYGSSKQYFWYADPYMRFCLDMNQGGAMIDLRPYAAKLDWPVGIGTAHVQDASYPFLIQANYRAGYFTHYAGAGTIKSCKVAIGEEETDLCLCRTHAHYTEEAGARIVTLDPTEVKLSGVTAVIQTVVRLHEGSGTIEMRRSVLSLGKPEARVRLREYMTACYGTTEYAEDMTGVTLEVGDGKETERIAYAYRCRKKTMAHAVYASARIPQIRTRATLFGDGADVGCVEEGYAFSPMFTLKMEKEIGEGEVFCTWLRLERAD